MKTVRVARYTDFISASVLALLLTACGGGGDDRKDATLTSLSVSGAELDQTFQPTQPSYTATVPFLTTSVGIDVDAGASGASVTVNGQPVTAGTTVPISLNAGANAIQVVVTNGPEQQQYTVDVTRGSFVEQAYLKSSTVLSFDSVGTSMGASGDTAVAGTPFDDANARGVDATPADRTLTDSGAAYAFGKDASGTWVQQAFLKASNADAGDYFGYASDISGDTIVVGAPGESSSSPGINGSGADNTSPHSGAAYVFVRDADGHWTQQAYIKPSDPTAFFEFGHVVKIDGDRLAVASGRLTIGSVYLFSRDASGLWHQDTAVGPSDDASDVAYGDSLALDGDTLAVGAKWHRDDSFAGAVYVYEKASSGDWDETNILKSSNIDPQDSFGWGVSLSGDTLVAGALTEASNATGVNGDGSDNSAPQSGAAYVFRRSAPGEWAQEAYLKASNTGAGDDFGYSVSVRGDWIAVAAENEGSSAVGIGGDQDDNSAEGSGAVYLYSRDTSGAWSQQLYVKASNAELNVRFGRTVVLTEHGLVVASPFENGRDASERRSGALYVFQ